MNWLIKKLFVDSYIKSIIGKLLKLLDGKKRYLAIGLFVVVQLQGVITQVESMQFVVSYLDVVIDVLTQSVTMPTPEDYGVWGFLLIALFDALRKAVEDDYR